MNFVGYIDEGDTRRSRTGYGDVGYAVDRRALGKVLAGLEPHPAQLWLHDISRH